MVVMPNHVHGIFVKQPVGVQNSEPLHTPSRYNRYQHTIPGSLGAIKRSRGIHGNEMIVKDARSRGTRDMGEKAHPVINLVEFLSHLNDESFRRAVLAHVSIHRVPAVERFGHPTSDSLSTIIRGFKAAATKRMKMLGRRLVRRLWQRGFYEHIVRDDRDLHHAQDDIRGNPARWSYERDTAENLSIRFDADKEPW